MFRIIEDRPRRNYHRPRRNNLVEQIEQVEEVLKYLKDKKDEDKKGKKREGMDAGSQLVLLVMLFPFFGAAQFYAYAWVIHSAMSMLK